MAPGGSTNCRDCDDCGYQDCLAVGFCLAALARMMGVDPLDLVPARPVWVGVDLSVNVHVAAVEPRWTFEQLEFLRLSLPDFGEGLERYQRAFLTTLERCDQRAIPSDLVIATSILIEHLHQDTQSEGARRE